MVRRLRSVRQGWVERKVRRWSSSVGVRKLGWSDRPGGSDCDCDCKELVGEVCGGGGDGGWTVVGGEGLACFEGGEAWEVAK